mgnify:CR=1 FL=1
MGCRQITGFGLHIVRGSCAGLAAGLKPALAGLQTTVVRLQLLLCVASINEEMCTSRQCLNEAICTHKIQLRGKISASNTLIHNLHLFQLLLQLLAVCMTLTLHYIRLQFPELVHASQHACRVPSFLPHTFISSSSCSSSLQYYCSDTKLHNAQFLNFQRLCMHDTPAQRLTTDSHLHLLQLLLQLLAVYTL